MYINLFLQKIIYGYEIRGIFDSMITGEAFNLVSTPRG